MADLDSQLRAFYDAESRRRRLVTLRERPVRPIQQLAITLGVLVFAVSAGAGLLMARSAIHEPVATTTTQVAAGTPGLLRIGERTAISAPGHVCHVAAASQMLLVAVAQTANQVAGCTLALSADAGATWTLPAVDGPVSAVAIAPSGDLFAGMADGTIVRSARGGTPWSPVYQLPPGRYNPSVTTFAFGNGEVWAGDAGVLESADGIHWRDVTAGLGSFSADPRARSRFAVVGLVARPSGVVAAINGNIPEVGVWSLEAGSGWRQIGPASLGQPVGLVGTAKALVLLTNRGGIYPNGSTTPAAWMSTDDGATWTRLDHGPGSGAVIRSAVSINGEVAAAAADGLLQLLGTDWQPLTGRSSTDVDVRVASFAGSYLYVTIGTSLVRYRVQPGP